MNKQAMEVGYHKSVDLKELFPMSGLYAFRKTFTLFLSTFVLSVLCAALQLNGTFKGIGLKISWGACAILYCVLLYRYIYAELYRLTFRYGTEGLRLMVKRGVLIRSTGSLPLLPVTEIYTQRGIVDMLCNLCNVDVFTPMDTTRKFARIESLSYRDAQSLQQFLGEVLNTQVFLAPDAKEGEGKDDDDSHPHPNKNESLDHSLRTN